MTKKQEKRSGELTEPREQKELARRTSCCLRALSVSRFKMLPRWCPQLFISSSRWPSCFLSVSVRGALYAPIFLPAYVMFSLSPGLFLPLFLVCCITACAPVLEKTRNNERKGQEPVFTMRFSDLKSNFLPIVLVFDASLTNIARSTGTDAAVSIFHVFFSYSLPRD